MAKTLVIAEKYLAACDMAEVLCCQEKKDGYMEGENYIITWADGHLIGYQYPEEYNPQYKEKSFARCLNIRKPSHSNYRKRRAGRCFE